MEQRELIIDGTGLMFIKTSTDLDLRIKGILHKTGISKYRIFLKEKINNKLHINKRFYVEKELKERYNAEVYEDMKTEIVKLYNSDKEKYMVATLSGELFDMLTEITCEFWFKGFTIKYDSRLDSQILNI